MPDVDNLEDFMSDADNLEIFLSPIRTCKLYKPKFGQSGRESSVSLEGFKSLYGSDKFYAWIGLDSELMYAAHKAAGGMTSVYRQIGIGCERLFRKIILDTVGYESPIYAGWSYTTTKNVIRNGKPKQENRVLTLDGRLEFSQITTPSVAQALNDWVRRYCAKIDAAIPLNGVVFEVRQGYKSKDSKRQNADIENASTAWAKGYLPIFAIFSAQIDADNMNRYMNSRAGVLIGNGLNDDLVSLFAFIENVLGYDIAGFFERNSDSIKHEMNIVLDALLRPE
jgi:hypothetical protein